MGANLRLGAYSNKYGTSPHNPNTRSHQSRLHDKTPWPLTGYLNSTRKGLDAPLEHPPLVLGNKDCTDLVNIYVKVMM